MTATTLTGHQAGTGPGRRAHTVIDSPVGPITLLAVDGALTGLYLSEQRYPPAPGQFGEPDAAPFAVAAGQLADYFAGRLTRFSVPLAWPPGPHSSVAAQGGRRSAWAPPPYTSPSRSRIRARSRHVTKSASSIGRCGPCSAR